MRLLFFTNVVVMFILFHLSSCTDTPPTIPRLTDEELAFRISMEFSDDGNQLMLWTKKRLICYHLSEHQGNFSLKTMNEYELTPSASPETIDFAHSALFPLYEVSHMIPPEFSQLLNAVLTEKNTYENNKLYINTFKRVSNPCYIGSFINEGTPMLLMGKEKCVQPVGISSGSIQREMPFSLAYDCTSISLNKEYLISIGYHSSRDFNSSCSRYIFLRNGMPHWEIREDQYTDRPTGLGSLASHSYLSPSGKYAFIQLILTRFRCHSIDVYDKLSLGYDYDKHLYLLLDVVNKQTITEDSHLVIYGNAPEKISIAIDETHKRIAILHVDSRRIELKTFE